MMWVHERSSKSIRLDSGEFETEAQWPLTNHYVPKEPYLGAEQGKRERKAEQRRYNLTLTVMKWRNRK